MVVIIHAIFLTFRNSAFFRLRMCLLSCVCMHEFLGVAMHLLLHEIGIGVVKII